MKKSSMAWTLISILLLCGVSLTSILFCFQMKVLGFSLMELVVIMSTVILLNILIAMIVLYPYQAASTLVCVSFASAVNSTYGSFDDSIV